MRPHSEGSLQGLDGEVGEERVVFHLRLQIGPAEEFRREQQCPATDGEGIAVIFLAADLTGLDGDDGTVRGIEHFHSIGQVPREILLDEEPVNAVIVEAGVDWGDLVIVDDAYERMQDRGIHGAGIDIGVGDLQIVLHGERMGE